MRKIIYISVALLALAGLIFIMQPKPIAVNSQKVSRGIFELTIDEEGKTQVIDKFIISAPISGLLRRVEVHAGEPVKARQKLATVVSEVRRDVLSPTDGYILKVLLESEGYVNIGTPILEVANTRDLEVLLDVLSAEAVKIKKGQIAHIGHWGGDIPLRGVVSYVEPGAQTKISVLGVEEQRTNVRIALTSPKSDWEGLGDGYRVEGQIVIQHLENALLVPLGAIFKSGSDWKVFKIINGRAKKLSVKISNKNSNYAVVESGLSEGDEVILYPADIIEDNQAVIKDTSQD